MGALAIAFLLGAVGLALAGPSHAQDANADHYRKVDEIAGIASEHGCASTIAILRARYAVSVTNARCQPEILKTSLPAKQLLTFSFEGRPYTFYVPVNAVRRRGEPRAQDAAPK